MWSGSHQLRSANSPQEVRRRPLWPTASNGPATAFPQVRPSFPASVGDGQQQSIPPFSFRNNSPSGWDQNYTLLLGVVVAAAGMGSALGTLLASRPRDLHPVTLVTCLLVVDVAVAGLTAFAFGLVTVLLLSFVVGLCRQLGKLSLDATIQEHISDDRRTSVFSRSETLIQLSWVLGGGLAVALPANGELGMSVNAVVLILWWVLRAASTRPPVS